MPRTNSKKSVVVLATATFYNFHNPSDKVRATLALRLAKDAKRYGYPLIIVDGGSGITFQNNLKKEGVRVSEEKIPGMGAARRQAFREAFALGAKIVVYLEPEKYSFLPFVKKCVEPILTGKADMVIPKRKSLKTLPLFQQHSEFLGNFFCEAITGKNYDIFFGVRIFNKKAAQYFLDYRGKYGDKWDSILTPIVDAMQGKNKIVQIEIPYRYDPRQTRIEEHDIRFYKKRMEQLTSTITAIEDRWNFFQKNNQRKLKIVN